MSNVPVLLRCPTCLKQYSRSIRVVIDQVWDSASCLILDVTCVAEDHESKIELDKA